MMGLKKTAHSNAGSTMLDDDTKNGDGDDEEDDDDDDDMKPMGIEEFRARVMGTK